MLGIQITKYYVNVDSYNFQISNNYIGLILLCKIIGLTHRAQIFQNLSVQIL